MGDYFCMNVEKDFILHICFCLSLYTDSCIRIGAGTATLPKHLSSPQCLVGSCYSIFSLCVCFVDLFFLYFFLLVIVLSVLLLFTHMVSSSSSYSS